MTDAFGQRESQPPVTRTGVEAFLARQNAAALDLHVPVAPPKPPPPRRSWIARLAAATIAGVVAGIATVVVIELVRSGTPAPSTPDALTIGPVEVTSSPAIPATRPAQKPAPKPAPKPAIVSKPAIALSSALSAAPSKRAVAASAPKKARPAPRAATPATTTRITITPDDDAPPATPPTTDPDAPLPH